MTALYLHQPQHWLHIKCGLNYQRPLRPMIIAHRYASRVPNQVNKLAAQSHRLVNVPVQRQIGLSTSMSDRWQLDCAFLIAGRF